MQIAEKKVRAHRNSSWGSNRFRSRTSHRRWFCSYSSNWLDDVFDFLDEWPQEKRDVTYEVMLDVCRKAANRQLPASVGPLALPFAPGPTVTPA
ncbi:hypothetical protein [Rhizobium leguminosarum]|uniref:hypothetical protein n=1 Tax=Rhizobium leguminosarum TaxID=384 RepID=UPI0021BC0584|nr:hypothetical protein [Rhizobium leguminosarum]